MYFILSKTIGILTSLSFYFSVLIALLVIVKSNKFKKKLIGLLCVSFFIFTNQAVYTWAVKIWAVPITPLAELKSYDIGIVLGGASHIEMEDTNRVFLNENAGDRIVQAIHLYKIGKIKKILFTSGSASLTGNGLSEASQAKKLFLLLGVDKEDLILESKSRNTYENALFSAQILNQYSYKTYLLISNSLHLKRGLACFKKQGIDCTPFAVDNEGTFDKAEWHMYIVPKLYVLNGWERMIHEIVGFYAYKIKKYV
jgi:uncharacterized SAM-binding protein YcdF (DUF218 family)